MPFMGNTVMHATNMPSIEATAKFNKPLKREAKRATAISREVRKLAVNMVYKKSTGKKDNPKTCQ